MWSLCSVDFHTLTLQLPIQTPHSVVPELQVFVSSLKISAKRAHPQTDLRYRAATTGPTSCQGPCRDTCRLQVMHAHKHICTPCRHHVIHAYIHARTYTIHTYTYAHTHCAVPTHMYIHTRTYTLYRHQVIHTYIHTRTYTPCRDMCRYQVIHAYIHART